MNALSSLGRRSVAHSKRSSPRVTTRRSGTTALPFFATREGEHSCSPGCRAPLMALALRNHSAVRNDRPPDHGSMGGRAFLLAILQRITNPLRNCQPTGGPELNPLKYPFHVCHHSTRLYVEIVYAHN